MRHFVKSDAKRNDPFASLLGMNRADDAANGTDQSGDIYLI